MNAGVGEGTSTADAGSLRTSAVTRRPPNVTNPAQAPETSSKEGPAARESGEPLVDLLAVWRPLRKHWLTALSTAVLVTVGVSLWTMRQTKIYEATATVQFDPNPPRPLGGKVESIVELGSGAVWDTREYYETQYQILQSRRVSLGVVQQLGLNRDHTFLRNLPKGLEVPGDPEPWSEEAAADLLRSRLRVDPMKQSRLATVRLQDANPERAARILKTVVETYRDQNVSTLIDSTDDASRWLAEEHDKLYKELEKNEIALHQYKEDKNILSVEFDDKSNMLREEIAQLNQALTSIRTRREEVAARRAELSKVVADPSVLPASELLQSQQLQNLRQEYVSALRERESLLKGGMGKNHPEVLSASAKEQTSREALIAEVKNIQGALDRDLSAIGRQEGGVSGLYERAKKEALELNLLEIEYSRLRRSKDNTEKLYSLLLERSKESDLTRRLRMNNVSIVDYPVEPNAPVKPNLPINAAGGLAFGLLLGAAAALGRGMLDRTVKTPADLEQLGIPTFLGLIPEIAEASSQPRARRRDPSGQAELIVHQDPMSGVAEASRSIRTNLLFMAPDKPYRTLLVTSAGPAEGKTTIACCIATAIAQAGKRVCLVDCDLRRPRLHRIFRAGGRDLGPGLATALVDDGLKDFVAETEVPNLWVVPAGPIPPNPSELLHSERFRTFLARLSERFDQVILDSPPVAAVTDATILSTLVDGTVLVVRANRTGKEVARHANRLLHNVGANFAGCVLNAVNLDRDEYKYSYYYYRREGYYAEGTRPSANGPQPPSAHA